MCFSAEASFIVGGALIPAGIYCLWAAAVKKPSYLGLAAVPVFFGVQQISEGFVWLATTKHHHDDSAHAAISQDPQVRAASLFFLFFALALWPFWFPVLTTIMEPERRRKWIFAALSVVASVWFWILYFPLLQNPDLLTVSIETHSVQYQYEGLAIYNYIDRLPLRILYLLSVAVPPMFGSENWGRLPGLVLGASALVAAVFYNYAFVSVWCFFAAVLAIYLCVVFYRLPAPQANPVASPAS